MESVRIELPSALLRAANLDNENLSQEAARLLALELFREEKVSLGRVADFMDFAAKHGVPPLRYSHEDLEEERRITDRFRA